MLQNEKNLIWIDLEMTGLDTTKDYIIEIATIVTDSELQPIEQGPVLAIHQSDQVLYGMDQWNTKQHGQSGLVERVRASKIDARAAELQTLEFLKKYVPPNKSPMCGNSICQDRRFLARLMPELEQYFFYRNLDVSAIKEVAARWAPNIAAGFSKTPSHQALEDVRDSIRELQYYRETFFRLP